uniref:Calmodulin n=2 Tax=Craspedostauros australis TaxID=1486917 RepID=A0A7R9WYF2_9STRA|mmetsp:Transcript_4002/g.10560  ORF Transcript_4002/g.10560 Transcript_4002/m.10560 type:complete len:237 (+) Transcript_4002:186-896(+)
MPSLMGKEKKQQKLINDLPNVFRSVMKKYNLAPGDFPDITGFSAKLREVKFAELHSLSEKQMAQLDEVLNKDIPSLMEELPSERDSPETLRAKMGTASAGSASVPLPKSAAKFGKKPEAHESNPFGYSQEDTDHYWALQDSADRLVGSFESLGPEGGFLSTQKARDVLVKTGLGRDELRQIWNLSDMDRDGYFDFHEYVVAMFLCDAVVQKGRPIPSELPTSVVPPAKRHLFDKKG